ncbi:MAG TPA: ferritin-like protein, partial [Solirubrobacteraceae bacterium]|nr:ferritin-like protein [Solirubrobacteraceae bacterium]
MLFIKPGLFAKLETPEGLKTALQAAIELEHATIPPYLYALFSLEPNSNTEIGELIDSVVKEEMAHMAMACNILNAIGGKPAIATREFVPTYPGPLPGTVEEGLIVHLRAFSLCQLETTFMAIEEPEEPLNIPDLAEAPALTIGAFYTKIKQQIEAGGPSIFVGDPARQVTVRSFPEVIPVTDVATAS